MKCIEKDAALIKTAAVTRNKGRRNGRNIHV